MASTLETLVVKLVADASRLEGELNKQVTASRTAGQKISAAFVSATRGVAALGAAAVGAGTALTVAANRAAAYADTIDKTALRTRLSRDTLQELAFAADQAGVQFTAIEANIRAFTGRLAEVERGSVTVAATFDRLGVSLRDSNGALRDTESLFLDTLTALSGLENETERAALAVQAFGEQGSALLPFLTNGANGIDDLRARARELGLVLDNESIAALVAYKDELSAVQQQFGAVTREITLAFLPVLTEGVLPAVQTALDLFRGLPDPLQRAVTALAGVGTAGAAAAVALKALGVSAATLFGPGGLLVFGAAAGIIAIAAALSGDQNSLDRASSAASDALAAGDKASLVGALDEVAKQVDDNARPALERLRSDLIQTGDVSVEQASRIAAALAATDLQERARGAAGAFSTAPLDALTTAGQATGRDFVGDIRTALDSGNFVEAIGLVNEAISRLRRTAEGLPFNSPAYLQRVEALEEFVVRLQQGAASAVELGVSGFRDPGTATPAGSLAGRSGAASGTVGEAGAEAAEEIVLSNIAAIPDDPALSFTDRRRQSELLGQISGTWLERSFAAAEGAIEDAATQDAGRSSASFNRLGTARDRLADAVAAAAAADLAALAGELSGGGRTIASFNRLGTARERLAEAQAAERAALAREVTGGGRSVASFNRFGTARERLAATLQAEAEALLVELQRELVGGGRTVFSFNRLGTARAELADRLAEELENELVGGGRSIASFNRLGTARDRLKEAVAAELDELAQQVSGGGRSLASFNRLGTARERLSESERAAREIEAAGDQFRDSVVLAGAQFTASLIDSIRSGDVGGAFQAAFGTAGSVLGALGQFGPAAGLVGASAAGPLGLIASLLPILGGIVGSLFSPRQESEATRAIGASARGAPAVEFNLTQNNSIAVNGMPEFRDALTDSVTQLARVIETNLIPRITRLEANA